MANLDTSTWTRLIRNATLATCAEGRPYGLIPKGAIALAGNRIAWVGSKRDVPATLPKTCVVNEVNYALVTPGLIDCHTHLVWAGTSSRDVCEPAPLVLTGRWTAPASGPVVC